MKAVLTAVTAALALLNLSVGVADELQTKDLAARIELRAFQSLTLTDQQFLTGDKNGSPVTIAGELRLPQGSSGRLPVVIVLHGAGGLGPSNELWSRVLNEIGIATFSVDTNSGRNLVSISTNQGSLGFFVYTLDAYRARDLLASHPRIDPDRIAVMGTSRGGRGALYASLKRFRDTWASGKDFAAYIPLYGACESPSIIGEQDVSDNPIRQFHGGSDDVVAIGPCKKFYDRLRAVGKDATLTEFAGVGHLFDNPAAPKGLKRVNIQTMRSCDVKEGSAGVLVNVSTRQPFTWDDPCVETDTHVGYDDAAMRATHAAVKDFLRRVFKLN